MQRRLYFFIGMVTLLYCSKDPVSVTMLEKFESEIEDVREQIQDSRQLKFLSKVDVKSITRAQYGNEYTYYAYADELMVTFKQLGYLPDTLQDLEQILIDYYTGFPSAYYTQGSNEVTIVESDITKQRFISVIAHEFTHALQDQHFNIGSSTFIPGQLTSRFNSDFYTARRCMIEGDAEIQELIFESGINSASKIVKEFEKKSENYLANIEKYTFPGYLRIRSRFPYSMGALYVSKLYKDEGWSGVNSLFHADRVLSTAEVLTGKKFEPVIFDVSDNIKEWTENSIRIQYAEDDNYGAVMIMALLKNYVNSSRCLKAFGWRGDRLIYMRSDDEQWGKMIWSFVFEESEDAKYIMRGLDNLIKKRKLNGVGYSDRIESEDSLSTITYFTDKVTTFLIRSDANLFWIEKEDNFKMHAALTIVSDIINSARVKRGNSEKTFEVSPEMIKTKKAIIDRMILGEFH